LIQPASGCESPCPRRASTRILGSPVPGCGAAGRWFARFVQNGSGAQTRAAASRLRARRCCAVARRRVPLSQAARGRSLRVRLPARLLLQANQRGSDYSDWEGVFRAVCARGPPLGLVASRRMPVICSIALRAQCSRVLAASAACIGVRLQTDIDLIRQTTKKNGVSRRSLCARSICANDGAGPRRCASGMLMSSLCRFGRVDAVVGLIVNNISVIFRSCTR